MFDACDYTQRLYLALFGSLFMSYTFMMVITYQQLVLGGQVTFFLHNVALLIFWAL